MAPLISALFVVPRSSSRSLVAPPPFDREATEDTTVMTLVTIAARIEKTMVADKCATTMSSYPALEMALLIWFCLTTHKKKIELYREEISHVTDGGCSRPHAPSVILHSFVINNAPREAATRASRALLSATVFISQS